MFIIVGFVTVFVTVFGGYLLEGGQAAVLFQPVEFLIIGGAAGGGLLISTSPTLLKAIFHQTISALKSTGVSKHEYLELLLLIFELCKAAKTNPLSLEPHVENPENSDIFKRYPSVLKDKHAIHFISDTLKVQISAPMPAYDLEDLMDTDIQAAHEQEAKGPLTVARIGDAMPGLGIVAAVLGVVITMGKLSQGKEVIGHSVGAALVGTFLGVLLSYGFIQPLAAKMELAVMEEGKFIQVIKNGLLAYAKECSPKICVEYARRTIPPHVRPTFDEVDKATSGLKTKAA